MSCYSTFDSGFHTSEEVNMIGHYCCTLYSIIDVATKPLPSEAKSTVWYRTPNNKMYFKSYDKSKMIEVTFADGMLFDVIGDGLKILTKNNGANTYKELVTNIGNGLTYNALGAMQVKLGLGLGYDEDGAIQIVTGPDDKNLFDTVGLGLEIVDKVDDNEGDPLDYKELQAKLGNGLGYDANGAIEVTFTPEESSAIDFNLSLPNTDWSGSVAPYSKQVTATEMLATDNPILDVIVAGDFALAQTQVAEWSKIYRVVSNDGSITFYAIDVPAVTLNIQAKVVR